MLNLETIGKNYLQIMDAGSERYNVTIRGNDGDMGSAVERRRGESGLVADFGIWRCCVIGDLISNTRRNRRIPHLIHYLKMR
jgi:hypothetical protein